MYVSSSFLRQGELKMDLLLVQHLNLAVCYHGLEILVITDQKQTTQE